VISLEHVMRLTGLSLVVLALFHIVLWRSLNWGLEIVRLSPLNARVFAVHTFFIGFALMALGALSLARPHLLLAPSELARWVLVGTVAFWVIRLALQPLVFDKSMRVGWTSALWLRVSATALWLMYVLVYSAALLRQLGVV